MATGNKRTPYSECEPGTIIREEETQQITDYKTILNLFVTKDELRVNFLKPSLIGYNRVCATDGHGMVIIQDVELAKHFQSVAGFPLIESAIPKETPVKNFVRTALTVALFK